MRELILIVGAICGAGVLIAGGWAIWAFGRGMMGPGQGDLAWHACIVFAVLGVVALVAGCASDIGSS